MHLTSASRLALVIGFGLTCAGCAAAEPVASLNDLCDDERVVECNTDGPMTVVTVSASASDEETFRLTQEIHAATDADAPGSSTYLRREAVSGVVLDPEYSTPAPWTLQLHPGDLADIEETLTSMMAIEDIPGALSIDVYDSWTSLTIETLDDFTDVFDTASTLPIFSDGGTYTLFSLTEHLRIVHTPEWVSPDLIHEVIAIASEYPAAEVLLEAPPGGATPPTLYIARLTPEQVGELDGRLGNPALAGSVTEGVELEYVLGSIGAEGTSYVGGVLGETTH